MGITLLKEKIEEAIENNRAIIASVSSSLMECRNTVYADIYEIEEESLFLCSGNFELHIDFNDDVKIMYDDLWLDEFTIVCNDIEVKIYFID